MRDALERPSSTADQTTTSCARPLHACYLVISLDATKRGKSYVGYTINPPRRLAQHNGALANGARYTASLRPCDMILVVTGFEDEASALRFEWAWQKPATCRATREEARKRKLSDRTTAPGKKAECLCAMLGLAPWRHMPLTLHVMSESGWGLIERHLSLLPEHVERRRTSAEEMEALVKRSANGGRGDDAVRVEMSERALNVDASGRAMSASVSASDGARRAMKCAAGDACDRHDVDRMVSFDRCVGCDGCGAVFHATCLAKHFWLRAGEAAKEWSSRLIPERGPCPRCTKRLTWGVALGATRSVSIAPSDLKRSNCEDHDDDDLDIEVEVTSGVKKRRTTSAQKRSRQRIRAWTRDLSDLDDGDSTSEELAYYASQISGDKFSCS